MLAPEVVAIASGTPAVFRGPCGSSSCFQLRLSHKFCCDFSCFRLPSIFMALGDMPLLGHCPEHLEAASCQQPATRPVALMHTRSVTAVLVRSSDDKALTHSHINAPYRGPPSRTSTEAPSAGAGGRVLPQPPSGTRNRAGQASEDVCRVGSAGRVRAGSAGRARTDSAGRDRTSFAGETSTDTAEGVRGDSAGHVRNLSAGRVRASRIIPQEPAIQ